MGPIGHGRGDSTFRMAADGIWRATRTPLGPATIRVRVRADDPCAIDATAWGDGAPWLLARTAGMVGALDSLDGFAPDRHPVVARLSHALGQVRLPRTERVL